MWFKFNNFFHICVNILEHEVSSPNAIALVCSESYDTLESTVDGKLRKFVRFQDTFGHFAVPPNARTPEWFEQLEGTINFEDFVGLRWRSRILEGCSNGNERTGLLSIVCDKEGPVGGKAHLGWIYPVDGRYPLCSSEFRSREILNRTLEIRRQSSSMMLSTPRDVRSLMFIKHGFI